MTHHIRREILPFTAIVGQERMKKALILNAINPRIGGVLIRGEKGTAKSTAVRALAELLPEIEVVNGCPFNCNPYDGREMCDLCYAKKTNGEKLGVAKRRMWVVDLPLGATEDRVVGSIDVEKAIKEGIKALEPGILAAANRGILYIDEVNLLDDHVADVILDSAAMSINVVEREGVSVSHPSKFILVGTMNPEEGELRPQLLDRFGLQASVESIDDAAKRVEIVKLVGSFEKNPAEFKERFEEKQKELREKIEHAKKIVNEVEISDDLLEITADTCIKLGVRTHRAEIVIDRTAKAIAAFEGRKKVTFEDTKEAMELALPHRMRRKPFEPPHLDTKEFDEMMSDTKKEHKDEKQENKHQQGKEHEHRNEPQRPSNPNSGDANNDTGKDKEPQKEFVLDIGDPIDIRVVRQKQKKDRRYRRKISGRRIPTLSLRNDGKYVRYGIPKGEIKDVALDATIRAAAPYQKKRRGDSDLSPYRACGVVGRSPTAVVIKSSDIREKIRVGKVSTATMFVVDASGSMGANRRMESAKGAALSLLLDSYQQRDKVGMVAFRGNQADVLLPLCSSVDLAYKSLKELPTGGRTPLSAGLERGLNLLMIEKKKDEGAIPVLVLISDGRANVSRGTTDIRMELLALAEQARAKGIQVIVIDTEVVKNSFLQLQLGYCREIASYSGGRYYPIADLTPQAVHDIVIQERERSLLNDLQAVLG
ncbi:MAG: putative cobaltochelatase [archaeon]|nr:putative cobaltochelatase [archaeon]